MKFVIVTQRVRLPRPEDAVTGMKAWAGGRSPKDCKLVAKGESLELESRSGPEDPGQAAQ